MKLHSARDSFIITVIIIVFFTLTLNHFQDDERLEDYNVDDVVKAFIKAANDQVCLL